MHLEPVKRGQTSIFFSLGNDQILSILAIDWENHYHCFYDPIPVLFTWCTWTLVHAQGIHHLPTSVEGGAGNSSAVPMPVSGSILIILARRQDYFHCYKQYACLSRGIYYSVWHNLHNSFKHWEKMRWLNDLLTKIDLGFSFYVLCNAYWGDHFLSCFKYYVPLCANKTKQNKKPHTQWNKKVTKTTLFLVDSRGKKKAT